MTLHSQPVAFRSPSSFRSVQPAAAQGFVVPIADSVAAIMFDEPSAAARRRPRLTARSTASRSGGR